MNMRRKDFILIDMIEKEWKKRVVYGFLSLLLPGTGQILSGRIVRGIVQMGFLGLFIYVIKTVWNGFNPGLFVYLIGIVSYWIYTAWDAYAYKPHRTAPCEKACPVGLDVSGYMNLATLGEFNKAKELIYHRTPFIGTLSYICHEPCKNWCARRKIDVPLEIRAIKRYIYENAEKTSFSFKKRYLERIAIVGAGPSGLSCAYFLSRLGYKSVVFDAKERPGGALMEFIPEFRLPRQVVERDVQEIFSTDLIQFEGRKALGRDFTLHDLQEEFDAVYLATGAWGRRVLDIPGEKLKGVVHALEFLRWVKYGKTKKIHGTIMVIGGGDVAADVARSAIRLSAYRKVILAYRRSKNEIRVDEFELSEMEEEGIEIMENVVPVEFKGKEMVEKVVFARTEVRNNEVIIKDERFEKDASLVILAIGQAVGGVPGDIDTDDSGRIKVDRHMETNVSGVFAGGDAVRGPSSLVEALRDGREAAKNIHKKLHFIDYLLRDFLIFEPYHVKPSHLLKYKYPIGEHVFPPRIPYNERINNFQPVELCYKKEEGEREASRCLACPFRYE